MVEENFKFNILCDSFNSAYSENANRNYCMDLFCGRDTAFDTLDQGTLTLFKGEVSVRLTSLYLPVRTRLF